ncbi:4Fe-4S dicluster domain-containing protein [Clostridiisalibacter paucivorans]|uniref:4Fe-4S dicluster domain-containing protein n=1 Tax=Clostridiisalibacter paucivorans TaxID=408753 RepID=UPI00047AA6B1|nr:4Fe-4S dicluster domain-containing protein [Clostridiisalibacter paucivorans]
MKRKIININQEKCNGCGLCVTACHEGAIEMVNGKAQLVSDEYCDGLGDCLPECPTGAITMIEREAAAYDDDAVKKRMAERKKAKEDKPMPCGCPGTAAKVIERKSTATDKKAPEKVASEHMSSELRQWPVQLNLINTKASYLDGADLLIAADCTAYAYANFHRDFIKGHITIIGCPKLDDNKYYEEKLTEILNENDIKSIKVVRMSVPCCGGIVQSVKNAMLKSSKIVPYSEIIVSPEGEIVSKK